MLGTNETTAYGVGWKASGFGDYLLKASSTYSPGRVMWNMHKVSDNVAQELVRIRRKDRESAIFLEPAIE